MLTKVKFFVLRLFLPFLLKTAWWLLPRRKKVTLVIKNDGIGDYILFRNFLQWLKDTERFRDHKIYVLANRSSKELALQLDGAVADGFFWYSDDYFMKWDLVRLLYTLQRLRAETIIHPNYSRKFTVDWLVSQLNASKKIGVYSDTINQPAEQKAVSDKYYSQLIDTGQTSMHEFERNKKVFEAIAGEKCQFGAPFIEKVFLRIHRGNRIIVFTGASNAVKTWPATNFNELCKKIIRETPLNIMIVNGKEVPTGSSEIMGGLPENRVSMLADPGLVGLCELIGGARLVVTGDTAAVHIAAALAIPTICIAKGDLYGRFVPYPESMNVPVHCVFPPGFDTTAAGYSQYSPYSVADVDPEMVYSAINATIHETT